MRYGLTQQQFEFIQNEVVNPLVRLGAQVYCFGSRARGDFKEFSDLDLMIEGAKSQGLEKLASEIQERLIDSHFPFKVDLVFLEDFASSYRQIYGQEKSPWLASRGFL
jgi:predicted nucleotidyltransferase